MGNNQTYCDSYYEVFTPTTTPEGIRTFFAVACARDWDIRQFDFSTAYLNAQLKEKIYAYPPEGVEDPDGQDRIWLLLKSLYRAKQSARSWNHFLPDLLVLLDLRIVCETHYVWAK